jgi:hypothetical protein
MQAMGLIKAPADILRLTPGQAALQDRSEELFLLQRVTEPEPVMAERSTSPQEVQQAPVTRVR